MRMNIKNMLKKICTYTKKKEKNVSFFCKKKYEKFLRETVLCMSK